VDDRDARLARAITQLGLAPPERVRACTEIAESAQPGKPLGQVLIEERVLSVEQVFAVLRALDAEAASTVVAPATGHAVVGQRFARYAVLEELGRGSMGCVYKARDEELGRVVALKVLNDSHAANASVLKRFQREAQTASRLRHPNIAAIHDVGTHQGAHYFTMDYVEGASLERLLMTGALSLPQAVEMLETVARAVHHAHTQGVVHRDLKPANIVVDVARAPFVLDFGLARSMEDESRMTRTGQSLGTPLYMAPEQVRGEPAGPAADVYALGVILYQALTRRTPFTGASVMEIYSAILHRDPVPPRELRAGVPPDLETVCAKAMAKEPADRYAAAIEFADELGRWRRGEPIRARRKRLMHRVRRRLPAVAILALCAAVAAGLGWWRSRPDPSPPPPAPRNEADILVLDAAKKAGRGEHEAAVADCTKALALRPGDRDALVTRGLCLLRLGRTLEGLADLEPLPSPPPEAAAARAALPVERLHELDYTNGERAAGLTVQTSHTIPNAHPTRAHDSLVLTTPGASRVTVTFQVPAIAQRAALELEHLSAGGNDARGGTTLIDVSVNGVPVVKSLDVGEHQFRPDVIHIGKYLKVGENTVEVRLAPSPNTYWLKRLAVRCMYAPGTK